MGPVSTIDTTSVPFVGAWNRLVSRTNWEKGRIICQWREALIAAGAPATDYSDEAWAARVGGVSGQHIGRLRRVALRFGDVHDDYDGLYWSHFYAALDWQDAEMWLEGAVQNNWSVSQMRGKRWETLGSPDELKPSDTDIVVDEEAPIETGPAVSGMAGIPTSTAADDSLDPAAESARAGQIVPVKPVRDDEEPVGDASAEKQESDTRASSHAQPVRPFSDLPDFPDDLADALEQFKLAIVAHKMNGWRDVPRGDVLAALDALKALVLAPAGDA